MKRTTFTIAGALASLSILAGPVAAHGWGKGASGDSTPWPMILLEFDGEDGDEGITMDGIRAAWSERFSEADIDGDGQLSAGELATAVDAWQAERGVRRIQARVERHDSDGDGLLDFEEATAALAPRSLERLFERLDEDGDGTITKAEMDDEGHGRGRGGGRRWH